MRLALLTANCFYTFRGMQVIIMVSLHMLSTILIHVLTLQSAEQPSEIGVHIELTFTGEEIQEQKLHKIKYEGNTHGGVAFVTVLCKVTDFLCEISCILYPTRRVLLFCQV